MTRFLEHAAPECTGRWFSMAGPPGYITCEGCSIRHEYTGDNYRAAARENHMDDVLHWLERTRGMNRG